MLRLGAQVKVFGGEATGKVFNFQERVQYTRHRIKGWLAIAKLKPLSLFISLLLMLKKALDNGKMVK